MIRLEATCPVYENLLEIYQSSLGNFEQYWCDSLRTLDPQGPVLLPRNLLHYPIGSENTRTTRQPQRSHETVLTGRPEFLGQRTWDQSKDQENAFETHQDSPAKSSLDRFMQNGNIADVDAVIKYYQEALELRPPGHPDRAVALQNVAYSLVARFKRNGDPADLDAAIKYDQEALELCPPGHPQRGSALRRLVPLFRRRFKDRGDVRDIYAAKAYSRELLQLDI